MGQITDYSAMGGAPAANDLLFIADTSSSYQIKSITTANLHKTDSITAATSAGITITDDGGTHGIEVHDGGNVGIGAGYATTPTSYLDVRGASDASLTLAQFLNPSATTDGTLTQILVGTDRADYKSLSLRYTYDTTNDDGLITLRHYEDPTEGIHIKGDGNVGINDTSPNAKLDVYSSTDPRIRVNFNTAASVGRFVFAESDSNTAYIQYMGSANTSSSNSRRKMVEFVNSEEKGFSFWNNTTLGVNINSVGNLGVGTGLEQESDTVAGPNHKIHIEGTGTSLLRLNATDTDGTATIAFTNNSAGAAEANKGYITNANSFLSLSNASSVSQNTGLAVNKVKGWLNIGGSWSDSTTATFTYPLEIGDQGGTRADKTTAAYFSSEDSSNGVRIALVGRGGASVDTGVAFGNSSSNTMKWLAGSFVNNSVNYFGIQSLTSITNPDSAAFNTTLESNTFYINGETGNNVSGGANARNIPCAFGIGYGNGTLIIGAGQYNVASVAIASTNEVTYTFRRDLDTNDYTVMATGWDNDNTQVIYGVIADMGSGADRKVGSVKITFKGSDDATPDMKDANVQFSWAIYGAKLKNA